MPTIYDRPPNFRIGDRVRMLHSMHTGPAIVLDTEEQDGRTVWLRIRFEDDGYELRVQPAEIERLAKVLTISKKVGAE